MAQLVFEIKNQWISRTDTFKPVAKSKNYLYAQFNFLTDEWVGVPTAIFRNKTSAYEQIIGQDGTCLVPWEVIDVDGDSEIFVSVFCGDLVTANKARVHVYDTGYGDDLESDTPPTPSVYEQILNRMDDIEEDMDDATRRAETAAENAEEASYHYPVILEDYWYVWDVIEREYVNTDIKAEGHDGTSATVEVEQFVGGHRVVITDVSGEHIFDVPDGRDGTDGRGIASLEKTSTSGDIDQYTMTFSDDSEPFVYYVTNGASATISTRAITNGYRLTITDKNGTRAIDVLNGAKGDPGNGIQSINKIGSYENYDYYEIRMTNGNKTSFTVTNGYSPTVEIVNITGGHRVIITDTNGAHSFDVMDGAGGGGVAIHICSSSEYDHTTGVPTIQNPEENTFYLVPSSESATHDMFVEWVYVNNAWEMFGSASIELDNLDAGDIAYDDTETYSEGSVGNGLGSLKAEIIHTFGYRNRNIQDKITESGRINNDGTDADSSSFVRTIYIPVYKNDIITYYNLRTGATYNVISFYTDNDPETYVGGIAGQGAGTALNGSYICPNDGYVRISSRLSDINLVYVSIDSDRVSCTKIIKHVDANGSDSNTGDTPSSAYATVAKAISEHADVIYIAKGTYSETIYNIYKNTTLIGEPGTVFLFNSISTNAIEFREALIEIENITVDMTGCTGSYSGIHVRNCIATLKNCTVKNTPYMGFLLNGSLVYLDSCTAINCLIDGFNGHDTPASTTRGVFYNCEAYGCGDDGLSLHEEGSIVVYGGKYHDNTSTGIAPHNNCNTQITGAYIYNNGAGIEALVGEYTIPATLPTMVLNNCMFEGNTGNAVTAEHYIVKASGNGMSGNGTDGIVDTDGSTITVFSDGSVQDVQVNGTSVVSQGVANVPMAAYGSPGVTYVEGDGLEIISTGRMRLRPANDANVKSGTATHSPITPVRQHSATFYGLAKAASDTTQSASSNPVGTYTDAAKIAIQKMLGIYEAPWELIREDTFTNATAESHIITVDGNGNAFELTDVVFMLETPVQTTQAIKSNQAFSFYDGDTVKFSTYNGTWTQEANSTTTNACWTIIESKQGLVFATVRTKTATGSSGTLYQAYNTDFTGTLQHIIKDNNFKITKIATGNITGTGHYKLYGKRKWS